ncbi:MAG: hypothetical protein QM755_20005 [Luteolibacter sp.]
MESSPKIAVEEIEISDAPEVVRFLSAAVGSMVPPSTEWLLWLAEASMLAGIDEVILGWKLVVNGEFQGIHLATPFRLGDASTGKLQLVSHNFYVAEAWRGMPGLALFRAFLARKKQFKLVATTANAQSGALWKALGGMAIPGTELEIYRLRIGLPLVEEAIVRRMPWLKRFLPAARLWTPRLETADRFLPVHADGIDQWPETTEDEVALTPDIGTMVDGQSHGALRAARISGGIRTCLGLAGIGCPRASRADRGHYGEISLGTRVRTFS